MKTLLVLIQGLKWRGGDHESMHAEEFTWSLPQVYAYLESQISVVQTNVEEIMARECQRFHEELLQVKVEFLEKLMQQMEAQKASLDGDISASHVDQKISDGISLCEDALDGKMAQMEERFHKSLHELNVQVGMQLMALQKHFQHELDERDRKWTLALLKNSDEALTTRKALDLFIGHVMGAVKELQESIRVLMMQPTDAKMSEVQQKLATFAISEPRESQISQIPTSKFAFSHSSIQVPKTEFSFTHAQNFASRSQASKAEFSSPHPQAQVAAFAFQNMHGQLPKSENLPPHPQAQAATFVPQQSQVPCFVGDGVPQTSSFVRQENESGGVPVFLGAIPHFVPSGTHEIAVLTQPERIPGPSVGASGVMPTMVSSAFHPLTYSMTNKPPPRFSGQAIDFPEYKRAWEEHLMLINAAGQVPEPLIFQRWLETLDHTNAKIMRARASQLPNTSCYQKLWEEFSAKMGRNASQSQRGKLESLTLSYQGKVTMKDFELFDSEFRLLTSGLNSLSQKEASFAYCRKLPNFLLEKIEKERLRHGCNEILLVKGLSQLTIPEVRSFIQNTIGHFPTVCKKIGDGFLVGVHSKEQCQFLMQRNGQALSSGCTFSAEKSEYFLNVDEISEIVRQTLEPRESAEEIKRNFAPQKFKPKARVQEVDMEEEDEDHVLGGGVEVSAIGSGKGPRGKKPQQEKKTKTQESTPAPVQPSGEGSAPSPGACQATPAVAPASCNPPPPVAPATSWNGPPNYTYNQGKGKGKGKGNDGKGGKGGKGAGNGGRGNGKGC